MTDFTQSYTSKNGPLKLSQQNTCKSASQALVALDSVLLRHNTPIFRDNEYWTIHSALKKLQSLEEQESDMYQEYLNNV
jgi:uncharacterized protein (UPF0147 family)